MGAPGPAPAARRGEKRLLAVLCALYAACCAYFYPPTYSIMDEQAYLAYGLVLAEGTLHPDEAGIRVLRSRHYAATGHQAPSFPPGTSALFAAALGAGFDWRACFAVVMLVHVLGTWACALALRRSGLSALWAALYLFHPVAVLYARTAMSDVPAMAFTMAGVAALCGPRRAPLLAGLALGASLQFRYAQLALVAALAVAALVRDLATTRQRGRLELGDSLRFALGLLPGLAALAATNHAMYGAPYAPTSSPFALGHLTANLPRYLLSQNLIYPGALLVACSARSPLRLECALGAAATLLLYGSFFHLYQGFGWLQQMVIGDRFFLPLAALLLPAYAGALQQAGQRLQRVGGRRALAAAATALLAAGCLALSAEHQRRLEEQAEIQRLIYAGTPEGAAVVCSGLTAFEYFFDGLGRRTPLLWTWLDPAQPAFQPALLAQLERALPRAYLLSAERTDRSGRDASASSELLRWAAARFELRLVRRVDRPPDRVGLWQLARRPAPPSER